MAWGIPEGDTAQSMQTSSLIIDTTVFTLFYHTAPPMNRVRLRIT